MPQGFACPASLEQAPESIAFDGIEAGAVAQHHAMNFNALGSGASMSAYIGSLLDKTGASGTSNSSTPSTASRVDTSTKAAAAAALDAASHSFKSTSAQGKLEKKEAALATDLRAAMTKAGVTLTGPVEFSVDSGGVLQVGGNDKDKAAVTAFLKNDATKPTFASRVSNLAAEADNLSNTIRQTAAISQAARYAGSSSNVMSLYGSLMKQQEATPAVFSLSATASSLTYPGVLASKA
jgi:outer membrane murein-binding lipoprotein Lpp